MIANWPILTPTASDELPPIACPKDPPDAADQRAEATYQTLFSRPCAVLRRSRLAGQLRIERTAEGCRSGSSRKPIALMRGITEIVLAFKLRTAGKALSAG